jgi:hypothetical protein
MTGNFAGLAPDVCPLAQELLAERCDVDHRVPALAAGSTVAGCAGVGGRFLAAGWLMGWERPVHYFSHVDSFYGSYN